MTATTTQQTEAQRLSLLLANGWTRQKELTQDADELDRQHAEIARLTAENARLKAENEALKEKVAGCDIMGLAEEQRQLRGPFHGIGTPNRAMFD